MTVESGIYAIVNEKNGKRYIGSAVKIPSRWSWHRHHLKKGIHHSVALQRAWMKYDADAFRFTVLLYCAPKDLLFFEQRAIDRFDSVRNGYNVAPKAGSTIGKPCAPETRLKISEKARERGPSVGWKHTEAGRRNMSLAKKAIGYRPSAEATAKGQAALRGRIRSVAERLQISLRSKGRVLWTARQRAQISARNTGWHPTIEQKARHLEAIRRRFAADWKPPVFRGEENKNSKLTAEKVREIRARRAAGEHLKVIAQDYGVAFSNVASIAKRLTWRHVD